MSLDQERHVVVCVDDDPLVLAALRRSLAGLTIELLTTESVEEALEWVKTRNVSLVITDQCMPEVSGTELLEKVREQSPFTACLVLTGHLDTARVHPRVRMTADRMLSKPWEPRRIRQVIREALRDLDLRELEEVELLKE